MIKQQNSAGVRIESLTFMRFIAAMIVVFGHFGSSTGFRQFSEVLFKGRQMVTFFFVLSGFVMIVAHLQRQNESCWRFYSLRIARIAPVYLVAMLCMILLEKGNVKLTAVVLHFTFLQAWFTPYPLKINPPAWSLSVEMFFYAAFPLIVGVINKMKISPRAFCLFAFGIYGFTQLIIIDFLNAGLDPKQPSAGHDLLNFFPLGHLCSFLLGNAAGYLYLTHRHRFEKRQTLAGLAMACSCVLAYLILQYEGRLVNWAGLQLPVKMSFHAPVFFLLILSTAFSNNPVTRLLSWWPLVLLGEVSYAIYVLQWPARKFFDMYLVPNLALNGARGFYVYVIFLITLAVASYYLVEKPAKRAILTCAGRIGLFARRDGAKA